MKYAKNPGQTGYERFEREVRTTAKLGEQHPGIVRIIAYEFPTVDDEWRPYYVMPLADATLARAKDLRVSNRFGVPTDYADANVGLRCAITDR